MIDQHPQPGIMDRTWQIYKQVQHHAKDETILEYVDSGTWDCVVIEANRLANEGEHVHIFVEPTRASSWASEEQLIGNIANIMASQTAAARRSAE